MSLRCPSDSPNVTTRAFTLLVIYIASGVLKKIKHKAHAKVLQGNLVRSIHFMPWQKRKRTTATFILRELLRPYSIINKDNSIGLGLWQNLKQRQYDPRRILLQSHGYDQSALATECCRNSNKRNLWTDQTERESFALSSIRSHLFRALAFSKQRIDCFPPKSKLRGVSESWIAEIEFEFGRCKSQSCHKSPLDAKQNWTIQIRENGQNPPQI